MSHYLLSDSDFETQVANRTIDPSFFNHEAHLRLAWIHIHKYGLDRAIENMQIQLKQFAEEQGAFDKYNKTLTIAATRAVYHFIKKSSTDNFQDFIEEFPRLKTDFKALMAIHYGFDIYNSARAKREYQEPDLLPFD
jgi:hypothetical protein